jgi:hypothetical protein
MPTRSHTFWVPKRGHAPEEYEDAAAADDGAGRYAVADGAAESAFARPWAEALVRAFVALPPARTAWGDWLPAAQAAWVEAVGTGPRPWYVEEKFEEGAFATFAGLVLDDDGWRAFAVGDACAFQFRAGGLAGAFPVERAADFGTAPKLLNSRAAPARAEADADATPGDRLPGDRFLLATDALAQWVLRRHEAGAAPWAELEPALTGDEPFAEWVSARRAAGAMKNDDVTLIAVYT